MLKILKTLKMEPRPDDSPGPSVLDDASFEAFLQALKGPKPYDPAELQREAQDLSRNLFASHGELRAILERHEATIQKRWIKKTKTQRQVILLDAWPNMAAVHRPDFDAFKKESLKHPILKSTSVSEEDIDSFINWLSHSQYREHFIWPYVNQEDLSKPKTLPLLLNARGRHNPCDFAAADGEAMRLGMFLSVIKFDYATQHVMVLNGAHGPDEYGKVFAFRDYPPSYGWFLERKQFLPDQGLIILQAQERLIRFLVTCCKQIMREVPEQILISDTFPIEPSPELKTETDTGGFHSLAIMAAEAPYRVPENLDFGRIEALIAAQASAAEDHMWSLREDPGYFTDAQRELKEHRPEMIKEVNGKPHSAPDKSRFPDFWGSILRELLEEAYIPLELFSHLQQQAQNLQALQEKYAPAMSPLETLPKEYLQAIIKFRYYLRQVVKEYGGQLIHRMTASPSLRRLFVRRPLAHASSSRLMVTFKPDIKIDHMVLEILWYLKQLWKHEGKGFFVLLPIIVDELQRLLDSEPKAKELVSPYVAGIIGKISIISQCLTQLDLYQPWASGFDLAMEEYKHDIKEDVTQRASQMADIYQAIWEKNLGQAVKLGDFSGGRFAYPIDKRRTRENIEILRQSEKNLDTFWAKVDEVVHSKAGDLTGTALRRLLSQPRIMQRTAEWMEPSKGPKEAEIASHTEQHPERLYKPLSALYFGLTPREPDFRNEAMMKTKKKTRGTATVPDTAAAASTDPLEEPTPYDPHPTISVSARALKVFRTLFFNPSPTATPGEVSWNDFLHAMTSTGFAAEKLYGSVWQFRPTLLDFDRSIQFHEPHPQGKIPFQVARRHGRRLNRAYGWFGGMFKLKEK